MDKSISFENKKISQELLKIDKRALHAYIGALRAIKDYGNPDRFSQSAHSLREVTAIISRKVSIPQEKKDSLKKKIEKQFVEKPELLPSPAEENTRVLITKWADLNRFFVNVSHHGGEVDEKEFLSRLSEFKAILFKFLKPVPEVFEELDSLLRIQSPKQDHITRLSELLRHPSHVEYFFLKLPHPNWLEHLVKNGFYANPPKQVSSGNYVIFPSWSLSKYLIQIADKKPKKVIESIKNIKETGNFRIHLDFIDCALKMPSSLAKEIIPLLPKWITTPYPSLIPEKLAELSVKLSNEGELRSALNLLETILDVNVSETEPMIMGKKTLPHFDLWQYERTLKGATIAIFKKKPYAVVKTLCQVLSKAIRLEQTNTSQRSTSHVWRPAIENHSQNNEGRDVKDLLITAIRDRMESLGKIDKKTFLICFSLLSKFNFAVFRRIEIHLMGEFPKLLTNQLHTVISKKETFDDISLWHEYYHLLHKQYSNFPQFLKEKILKWIAEGPDIERFVDWFKKKNNKKPLKAEKNVYKEHWQIGYLNPIRDHVPSVWKEKWQEFTTKYGKLDHPDFHFYMGPVTIGSKSPLTEEEIKKRTPQEVVDYLKTWQPSKKFLAPSIEGLAHTLSKVTSENPSSYTSICHEFTRLQPVYIYHLLSGFRTAIQKDKTLDWKAVILFCRSLLTSVEGKAQTVARAEETLYDWNSVYREIADLLKEGLKSKTVSPPLEFREAIWSILEVLLKHNEPDLAFEKKYGKETLDPVFLSLNTVRGKAMHSAIQYALWCTRYLNLSQKKDRMVPEVKEQLEIMLRPEYEPTKTIRAVYGLFLPQLFYLNRNWTEEHIMTIFPEDNRYRSLWNVAWEAYITYHPLYNEVYASIRSQYRIAINKLSSVNLSKVAKEHLSQHLVTAYLRELEDLKDSSLVSIFFRKVQPEIRGQAIWFIGRVLKNLMTGEVEEKIKQRIVDRSKKLWEWRIEVAKSADSRERKRFIEELKWFGIWFIYDFPDKDWSISQLRETLELTDGDLEFADQIVEKFQLYIEKHYLTVLKLITMLVKQESQRWMSVVSIDKIKELLTLIVNKYSHQEIKSSVDDLVDALAKKGYLEFAKFFIK